MASITAEVTSADLVDVRDAAAYLTVPAAIAFQREHDVRKRCVALAREARRELCELLGTEPIAPESMVLQMATVRLPAPDTELQAWLFDEHRIEVPVWRDGTSFRVSIAAYNDRGDVDRLLSALGRRPGHGDRDGDRR